MTQKRRILTLSLSSTMILSACMTPKSTSDVKHVLGEVAVDAPSFIWHDVPVNEKAAFASSQWNSSTEIVSEETLIHQRVQAIVDSIDLAARSADPYGLSLIPKPKVVILNSDDFNAFVTARRLCVKQPVEIEKLSDDTEQDTRQVLSLVDPESINETSISNSTYSCKLVDGDQIGWDVQKFVGLFNEKFNAKDRKCFLKLRQNTIVVPEKDCGNISGKKFEHIEYAAAANTIFFLTKLLKGFDEIQVATVAAHELAHYYRAHASYNAFPPYFFQQSKNNELKKPDPTNHHQDLQNQMLTFSTLTSRPKIKQAKFRPDMLTGTMPLVKELKLICMEPHPCAEPFKELLKIENSDLYFGLWDLLYSSPKEDMQKFYLEFETALIKTATSVEISQLDDSTKASITGLFSYIKKIDPKFDLDSAHSDVNSYLTAGNEIIEKAIPIIKTPFIAGAKQNLGFYSTEEEADEIGMELAARIGISGQKGPGLFQKFKTETLKIDRYEDPRETSYKECSDLRRNGWVKDGKSASSVLLIDSLSNIHHGLCYREFNSYREWQTHNLDRLHNENLSFPFDEITWKKAVASIPRLQAAAKETNAGNQITKRKPEQPYCVFSSHKAEFH